MGSAEQRAVKQVLHWQQWEWECEIRAGCNGTSTDLVWERSSHQHGV